MNEKQWETFFDLMEKIVNGPGTANEKIATFRAKAEEYAANVEEFACYLSDE